MLTRFVGGGIETHEYRALGACGPCFTAAAVAQRFVFSEYRYIAAGMQLDSGLLWLSSIATYRSGDRWRGGSRKSEGRGLDAPCVLQCVHPLCAMWSLFASFCMLKCGVPTLLSIHVDCLSCCLRGWAVGQHSHCPFLLLRARCTLVGYNAWIMHKDLRALPGSATAQQCDGFGALLGVKGRCRRALPWLQYEPRTRCVRPGVSPELLFLHGRVRTCQPAGVGPGLWFPA